MSDQEDNVKWIAFTSDDLQQFVMDGNYVCDELRTFLNGHLGTSGDDEQLRRLFYYGLHVLERFKRVFDERIVSRSVLLDFKKK